MNLTDRVRLELLAGPLTITECAAILELTLLEVNTPMCNLSEAGEVHVIGEIDNGGPWPQRIWELTTRGLARIYFKRIGDVEKVQPRIRVVKLSEALIAAHPFVVFRQLIDGDENGDEDLIGRFASLYCAAKTALHNEARRLMSDEGIKVLAGAIVRDERDGRVYERHELKGVELDSIDPVVFDKGQAKQKRQHQRAGFVEVS